MAATAVLTSCKKDNDTVSFRATISTYQNNGKVYIDNNRFANWIDEDEVLINGAPYTVEVGVSGDDRIASINGVRAVEEGGYYAIYPSECALTTPTSGFPQILLPQVQLYRSTTIDGQTVQIVEAPMAAYCSADRDQAGLDFTNLCSLLKITLPSAMEVGYITVSSSTPLWGKATISGTNSLSISSPEIESLYSTDNTVTLDCTNPGLHGPTSGASVGVNSRGPFYVVLPPATNVSNLTVSIYVFTNSSTASRRTITKYTKSTTNSNSITIESNKIYGIGDGLDDFDEEENAPDVPFPHLGSGEFSVSSTKKVRFALGNLQWLGNGNIWRFAPNQWDYIGQNPGNTTATGRSTQNDWIDLFGYGTSGNNGHYPWRTSTASADQTTNYATGNISNTDNDWGVNAIINGGNQPNKWRTLTEAEWKYLLGQGTSVRTNASNLHIPVVYIKFSNTNKIRGTLIFPDGYTGTKPLTNDVIPIATWNSTYANSGAVFLPVTGQRSGQSYSNVTTTGYYWTSTYETYQTYKPFARQVYFDANADHTGYIDTYKGNGVRLVRDVN